VEVVRKIKETSSLDSFLSEIRIGHHHSVDQKH